MPLSNFALLSSMHAACARQKERSETEIGNTADVQPQAIGVRQLPVGCLGHLMMSADTSENVTMTASLTLPTPTAPVSVADAEANPETATGTSPTTSRSTPHPLVVDGESKTDDKDDDVDMLAYPTSLADVKRQLARAQARAKREKEEADQRNDTSRRKGASRMHASAASSVSRTAASPSSPQPPQPPAAALSPSDLRALRLHRSSLESVRRQHEERLGEITWIEFGRQNAAMEFIEQQRKHAIEAAIHVVSKAARKRANRNPAPNTTTGSSSESTSSSSSSAPHLTASDRASILAAAWGMTSSALQLFALELAPRRNALGQIIGTGARKFIVTSYQDFWTRYFTLPPRQRHHYELIPECHPCHLYFDVEFKHEFNPQFKREHIEEERAMEAVCEEIVEQIRRVYGRIEMSMTMDVSNASTSSNDNRGRNGSLLLSSVDGRHILQLDSTSDTKFSRHLIVRLEAHPTSKSRNDDIDGASVTCSSSGANSPSSYSYMFRDNAHAGRFVKYICQQISQRVRQTMESDVYGGRDSSGARGTADAVSDPSSSEPTTATPSQATCEHQAQTASSSSSTRPKREAQEDDDGAAEVERQARRERTKWLRYAMVKEMQDSIVTVPPIQASPSYAAAHSHSHSPSPSNSPPQPQTLVVSAPWTPMIDQSVYSRNRSFRMFLSSKNTPPTPIPTPSPVSASSPSHSVTVAPALEPPPTLLVADSNRYPLKGMDLESIFNRTLICRIQPPTTPCPSPAFGEELRTERQKTPRDQDAIACLTRLHLLYFDESGEASIRPALGELSISMSNEEEDGVASSEKSDPAEAPNNLTIHISSGAAPTAGGKRVRLSEDDRSYASISTSFSSRSSRIVSGGGGRFHPLPSPFPRLEQFVIEHMKRMIPATEASLYHIPPRIRGWTYFKEQEQQQQPTQTTPSPSRPNFPSPFPSSSSSFTPSSRPPPSSSTRHILSFNIDPSSYRFCPNIGRSHKSNGVWFLLDLSNSRHCQPEGALNHAYGSSASRIGSPARTMVQKCWDHECGRRWRSAPIPIPDWIVDMDVMEREEEDDADEADEDCGGAGSACGSRTSISIATPPSLIRPTQSSIAPITPVKPSSSLFDDDDDAWDFDELQKLEDQALKQRQQRRAEENTS